MPREKYANCTGHYLSRVTEWCVCVRACVCCVLVCACVRACVLCFVACVRVCVVCVRVCVCVAFLPYSVGAINEPNNTGYGRQQQSFSASELKSDDAAPGGVSLSDTEKVSVTSRSSNNNNKNYAPKSSVVGWAVSQHTDTSKNTMAT